MAYNFHSNAAALVIAAAKKSGLLDGQIAEALCFIDKTRNPLLIAGHVNRSTISPKLLTSMRRPPVSLWKSLRGEGGANIPQYTEEELKPYFSIPFDVHVAAAPPRFDIDFNKIFPIDSTPITND